MKQVEIHAGSFYAALSLPREDLRIDQRTGSD
jgi:hypothetical protein